MFFTHEHSDLGDLEVMLTDYDDERDELTFMVFDEFSNEVDHEAFKPELIKTAKSLRDDQQAQDKFEEWKYG